ncbi:heme exporter protein CcmD [Methyloligella sp. GL2]|nr:heme exporter protein CcmD [Methyloligella sp. GL2]
MSFPDLGPHAMFIWAAYAVTFLGIAALTFTIVKDDRKQRRLLAELERRGIRRRSADKAKSTAPKTASKRAKAASPKRKTASTKKTPASTQRKPRAAATRRTAAKSAASDKSEAGREGTPQ